MPTEYDYDRYDYRQGDAKRPKKEEPSGLIKFLESLRVSINTGDGGGMSFDGNTLKANREKKDAERAEEIAAEEQERERRRVEYQKRLEEDNKRREYERKLNLAQNVATGSIPLYDRDSIGASEMGQDQGLGAGPASIAPEELQRRRFQTELGLGADPATAARSTVKAFTPEEPPKPTKPTQTEIDEYLFNAWEDVKEKFGGDAKAAWEALPPDAKRKLKFRKIYDPDKEEGDIQSDLNKALEVERKKRAAEYDKITNTIGDPRRAELLKKTKAQYVSEVRPIDIIYDPVYGDRFTPLRERDEQNRQATKANYLPGAGGEAAAKAAPPPASQDQMIQQLQSFLQSETEQTKAMRERIEQLYKILGVQ